MFDLKTPAEIELMREGGQKLGRILADLVKSAKAGMSLLDIEMSAQKMIKDAGGTPSFMSVEGYKWATCLCIDDEVVHGIPTKRILKNGELLTIDIGLIFRGFHSDTAYSFIIGGNEHASDEIKRFLDVGENTLYKAIDKAKLGNRIGHISKEIQTGIEGNGYHIVKTLVGHGVGRTLHEEPQIPGFLHTDINHTPKLQIGMTIAIEIIYAMGSGAIIYDNNDGWTLATKDGSLSAVFEHSLAITDSEALVLTKI
jgi:methionyl aminopeptidase